MTVQYTSRLSSGSIWGSSGSSLASEVGSVLAMSAPRSDSDRFVSFMRAVYGLPEGGESRIKWGTSSTDRPWDLGNALAPSTRNTIKDEKWLLKELDALHPELETLRTGEFSGLRNLGATCYVNATLQSLFTNVEFRRLILGISRRANAPEALRCLGEVFERLELSRTAVVDPRRFIDACRLSHGVQEDTSEFGNLLFNWLDGQTSEISRLFAGIVVHTTQCRSCGFASRREERFLELTVNFPEISDRKFALEDLLQMVPEEISDYHCSGCERRVTVLRKTQIGNFPKYLRVVINRYTYKETGRVKLQNAVSFPTQSLAISDHMYDLGAVLEHHSRRASDGHFTATARLHEAGADCRSEIFWKFNDSVVEPVPEPGREEPPTKKLRRKSEISSGDRMDSSAVYMLVFACRGPQAVDKTKTGESEISPEIVAENAALEISKSAFDAKNSDREASRLRRLLEVKTLESELTGIEISDSMAELSFVSRDQLHEWARGADISDRILDTWKFPAMEMCEHGKCSPLALARGELKVLPGFFVPEILVHRRVEQFMCEECTGKFSSRFRMFREFEMILKDLPTDKTDDDRKFVNKAQLPKCLVRPQEMASFDTAAFRKFRDIFDQKPETEEAVTDLAENLLCRHGNFDKTKNAMAVSGALVDRLVSISHSVEFLQKLKISGNFVAGEVKPCKECAGEEHERKRIGGEISGLLTEDLEIGTDCVILPRKLVQELASWTKGGVGGAGNFNSPDFWQIRDELICGHGQVGVDMRDLFESEISGKRALMKRMQDSAWVVVRKTDAEKIFPLNEVWVEVSESACESCGQRRSVEEGEQKIGNLRLQCRLLSSTTGGERQSLRSTRAGNLCEVTGLAGSMTGEQMKLVIVTHLADVGKFVKDTSKIKLFLSMHKPEGFFSVPQMLPVPDTYSLRELQTRRFPDKTWKWFVRSIAAICVAGDVDELRESFGSAENNWVSLEDEMEISVVVSGKTASTSDMDAGMQGSIFRDMSNISNA